jgi:outer membrane protein OmpA-like peptidoglycan-associated protein
MPPWAVMILLIRRPTCVALRALPYGKLFMRLSAMARAAGRVWLLACLFCLQTPHGNARASEQSEVHFARKQDNSFRGSIRTLRVMQKLLLSGPAGQRLQVTGHADDGGDATFNLELSKRRVRGVARWLMANGVAADQLQLLACGRRLAGGEPRAETARAQNRRVALQLVAPDALQQDRCDSVLLKP